jgi:hypothetical protein
MFRRKQVDNEPIITEVGIIRGRDAIYLDLMEQKDGEIILYGEINSSLIELKNKTKKEWLKYKLYFKNVLYYECCELDFYGNMPALRSSFDTINNSKLIETFEIKNNRKINKNHKHFIISTYDYIYEIVSSEYNLEIELN